MSFKKSIASEDSPYTGHYRSALHGPSTPQDQLEQSGRSSDKYSDDSDWEDAAFDVEALEQRRIQLEKDEATAKWRADMSARKANARKQTEETQCKVDEAQRKEEESKKKAEDVRCKEEEIKQKEEEAKGKEEEAKRREEEVQRTWEAAWGEEEVNDLPRREEQLQRCEQEATNQMEKNTRWEEALRKKEGELRKREEDLNRRESAAAEIDMWRAKRLRIEEEAYLKRMQDIEDNKTRELEQTRVRVWEEYVQIQSALEARVKQESTRKEAERRQREELKVSQLQAHTMDFIDGDNHSQDRAAHKRADEAHRRAGKQRQDGRIHSSGSPGPSK